MGGHWGQKLGRLLLRRRRRTLWMVAVCVVSGSLLYRGWHVMTILAPDNASNQTVHVSFAATVPVPPATNASNNLYPLHPASLPQTGTGRRNPGSEGQNAQSTVRNYNSFRPAAGGERTTPKTSGHLAQLSPAANAMFFKRSTYTTSASSNKDEPRLRASHEDGDFNFTEWARVQDERRRRLRDGCAGHGTLATSAMYTKSMVDLSHHFLYCPVEKSASTFFRRFMYSLQRSAGSRQILSPFDVPIDTALKHRFLELRATDRRSQDPLMMKGTRLVVVREPFSRIYSAYVDKVLVPNSYYWKVWNVNVVAKFRKAPSERARRCGHDVTFPEFVKYVISTLHNTNEHVKPVGKQCVPCSLQFSVIGHMETLKWDFQYLLKVLDVHIANFSADALMNDVVSDAISDSTYSAYSFYNELKDCVSLYETYQSLWLKMQLRGIISEDLYLPLSAEQAETVDATQMVRILHEASQNSENTERLHQQKANALKNAYASVSPEDLKTLINIYELDFDLFGYDKHPSFLG